MNKITISPRWRTALFLIAQTAPPLLMFYIVFGGWNIGVAMIIALPLLYSAFRIVKLLYKKEFRLLLRPTLTLLFAMIVIGMGIYYARESAQYVNLLAREMQEQCNHDGVCKLPPGEWKAAYGAHPTLFDTRTAGLVPMRVLLFFNENEQDKGQPKCGECQQPKVLPFTSFRLERVLEDHSYNVYGGVGRPLKIPEDRRD